MALTTSGIEATLTDGYAQFDYLAVGTGVPGVSGCGTEIDRLEIVTKSVSGMTRVLEAVATNAEAVGDLTEFAIMTAASGGTCLSYGTFTKEKTSIKGLIITITETWSA